MTPDDPRHGTLAGWQAYCRDTCCREAMRIYEKRRVYDLDRGRPRTTNCVGTRRRLQALQALGWPLKVIGERAGIDHRNLARVVLRETIYTTTAAKIARVYNELSMTPGPSSSARKRAAAKGWPVPLAWDDIDNPNEQPESPVPDRETVDEVLVQRALNGQRVKANRAERAEIIRRWTGSHQQLVTTQRWNWRVFKEAS